MVTGLGLGITGSAHKFAVAGRTAGQATLTVTGGVTSSSAQSKFGGTSLAFDATSGTKLTANPDYDDTGLAMTIEAWIRFNINPESQTSGGGSFMLFWYQTSGNYIIIQEISGGKSVTVADNSKFIRFDALDSGWNTDQWYHFAVTRSSGGEYNVWVDGNSISDGGDPDNPIGTGSLIQDQGHFGKFGDDRGLWDGYMDEIRFSSVERYTSSFTPPTAEFTNDADTVMLIHGSSPIEDDIS